MMTQSLSEPIAVRLPDDVLHSINQIAEASDRSRSWIIVRALRLYLDNEGSQILGIARGRQSLAQKGGIDIDDVIANVEQLVIDTSGQAA
jgi:predicted transcriptional regulator